MLRTCKKCLIDKNIDLFCKDNRLEYGRTFTCLVCLSEYKKNHYQNNKDKYILKAKIWKSKNKERVRLSDKKSRELNKEYNKLRMKIYQQNNTEKSLAKTKRWQELNKEKCAFQRKERMFIRRRTEPLFVFKAKIRNLISSSISRGGYKKGSKTENILGCSFEFFKEYIEAQFKKGMNWKNIHLDHINPISLAKTETEVLNVNHYTNFQPLFSVDNIKKSNKLIEKQLRLL